VGYLVVVGDFIALSLEPRLSHVRARRWLKRVCVCVCERERESVCVCVSVRETERVLRDRERVYSHIPAQTWLKRSLKTMGAGVRGRATGGERNARLPGEARSQHATHVDARLAQAHGCYAQAVPGAYSFSSLLVTLAPQDG